MTGLSASAGRPVLPIIKDARNRATTRRTRNALLALLAVSLAAVLLIGFVGLPGAGEGRDGGISEPEGAGHSLITVQQVRAEYKEGTTSKGRWLVSFRPDYRAIELSCGVPEAAARSYAATLRQPFPVTFLNFLEAKCA